MIDAEPSSYSNDKKLCFFKQYLFQKKMCFCLLLYGIWHFHGSPSVVPIPFCCMRLTPQTVLVLVFAIRTLCFKWLLVVLLILAGKFQFENCDWCGAVIIFKLQGSKVERCEWHSLKLSSPISELRCLACQCDLSCGAWGSRYNVNFYDMRWLCFICKSQVNS